MTSTPVFPIIDRIASILVAPVPAVMVARRWPAIVRPLPLVAVPGA